MRKLFIACLLTTLSGAAYAANSDVLSASWALGVAVTIIGGLLTAYVGTSQREIHRRLDDHAKNIGLLFSKTNDLRTDLQMNYHPKAEIRDVVGTAVELKLGPLDRKIDAIHARMDARGFPKTGEDK